MYHGENRAGGARFAYFLIKKSKSQDKEMKKRDERRLALKKKKQK